MEWHKHVNDCVISIGYDDNRRTYYYLVTSHNDERKFFCRNDWNKTLQEAIDFANKPDKELVEWYLDAEG